MKLTWYGTAALLLESGRTAIAFDPFLGIAPGDSSGAPARRATALGNVGNVFVTHGHFDHILQIPAIWAIWTPRALCTFISASSA